MSKHEIGCLKHCPLNSSSGGSWLAGAAAVGLLILGAGAWHVRHGIETGVRFTAIVIGIVVDLSLLAVLAFIGHRVWITIQHMRARSVRQLMPRNQQAISSRVVQLGQGDWQELPREIESSRTHPAPWPQHEHNDMSWLHTGGGR